MKNKTFDFHGTKMNIKVLTSESDGKYTIIDAIHPPNSGPALHMHPKGSETYFVVDGDYEFLLDNRPVTVKTGESISVPRGIPHRFLVGTNGGRVVIISPPDLEHYFYQVSELIAKEQLTWKKESDLANKYGQIFLDDTTNWK